MSIKDLEMRARIIMEGFWHGLHRSPYHGFSVEFTEYRQYTPGDDPRYLDWRLYARSDRYYIKKFEDETNLRCHFLVDHSRSMDFTSIGHTKTDYANTLAATLAYFLFKQGDGVGLLTFDESVRNYLPARSRPGHLRRLMHLLEQPSAGAGTDLELPLKQIVQIVRKRGLMVLISDLLAPLESLEKNLGYLVASGHEVLLFHVLDPAELEFPFDKPAHFLDVETGREYLIDPRAARQSYLAKVREHNAAVEKICGKLGIALNRLITTQPLELALRNFLQSRLNHGANRWRRNGRR
ncbi:MAG: DUF58 domain-containing protein [Akkermansiaceae bacterium]|nr:DUF58 domain-containing protein [Verrucomicrobiales bacterium]